MNEKTTLLLEGLDCAHCADEIVNEIRKVRSISSARIDFVSQKLLIEASENVSLDSAVYDAKAVIRRIEPDIIVSDDNKLKLGKQQENRCPGKCENHHHIKQHHDAHEHNTERAHTHDKEGYFTNITLSVGFLIFVIGLFLPNAIYKFILYLSAYLLIGGEVIWRACRNMLQGRIFDEHFLMTVATVGAFAVGEYPEGVAVMLFYRIGELLQSYAVNHSRRSIADLMDIRPDHANLLTPDGLQTVSPEQVRIGDRIVVKPGERIPLDGRVIDGSSTLDTSALTGESAPREVMPDSTIFGGCINLTGLLTILVTHEYGESTVSKILKLVEDASSNKAVTETYITKFARYYTPFVVAFAAVLAILPPLLIPSAQFSDWVYRALVFLVVSCPCALVISIPLSFFGGIGGASKRGILVKGSNYLEALANTEIVVFDKTGTLTKGQFQVTGIHTQSMSQDMLLEYAAYAESYSTHPIAVSIREAYGKDIIKTDIDSFTELSGLGIEATVRGHRILAGNARLMKAKQVDYYEMNKAGTVIHIVVDDAYAGCLLINDVLKKDAAETISGLRRNGATKIVMLTGDVKQIGEQIASELKLDAVYTELLPADKVTKIEELIGQKTKKGKLVFVGDGINDAPVLARSDIGVAMGGLGSDAAIEAADIVIMNDEPYKLISAIGISRRTLMIVRQNIFLALTVKFAVLVLSSFGVANMWEAVFADVGVTLIAIFNALRLLNTKRFK